MKVTLNSIVMLAAVLGAASAKKQGKRQCSTDPSTMEPTPTPTSVPTTTESASEAPSTTASPPSTTTPPVSGGGGSGGGEYAQTHNFQGDSWFDGWSFWHDKDPTNGRVQYVDQDTARSANLSYTDGDRFVIKLDPNGTLDPNGPGRQSVRIQMNDAVTKHTSVLDMNHLPQGMGTWPAYWTCGADWPNQGELDIVEGVNDGTNNLSSLHTSSGCSMPDAGGDRQMKGTPSYNDCDANGPKGNQGCGVVGDSSNSFGPNFNTAGGGWYAVERTDNFIKIWFWGRNDDSVPDEVKSNTGSVSPSTWPEPTAVFVKDQCDIGAHFGPHNYIINITTCGDWAGNAYPGGMDACNAFINSPGDGLQGAYFDIQRMTVYE